MHRATRCRGEGVDREFQRTGLQRVKLVKDAGQVLGEIVDAASRVASTVMEISSATSEQAGGVEDMARIVAHMGEMSHQNSLLADGSLRLSREIVLVMRVAAPRPIAHPCTAA